MILYIATDLLTIDLCIVEVYTANEQKQQI